MTRLFASTRVLTIGLCGCLAQALGAGIDSLERYVSAAEAELEASAMDVFGAAKLLQDEIMRVYGLPLDEGVRSLDLLFAAKDRLLDSDSVTERMLGLQARDAIDSLAMMAAAEEAQGQGGGEFGAVSLAVVERNLQPLPHRVEEAYDLGGPSFRPC